MNTKEIDLLTSALDSAKQATQDMEKKKQSKLLAPIGQDFSFAQLLGQLTKPELDDIRRKLDVKNASSYTKVKLIDVLSATIEEKIKYILQNIGFREFEIIKRFVDSDSRVIDSNPDDMDNVFKLREWGIVFGGTIEEEKPVIIVPGEVFESIKSSLNDNTFVRELEVRHNWLRVTTGLLYYTGTMDKDTIHKSLKDIFGQAIDNEEYDRYLEANSGDDKSFDIHGEIYYYQDVLNPEDIYNKQVSAEGLDYIALTMDEAIRASEVGFRDWNKENLLYTYIKNRFNLSEENASEILDGCIYMIKNDYDTENVLGYIQATLGILSEDEISEIASCLEELFNTTRLWVNKGHTQFELLGIEEPIEDPDNIDLDMNEELIEFSLKPEPIRKVKIGRNQPCPCGSGRKYKHCCGRILQ